ncbi:MAG TPA: tRNA (adenine-N1)-methyltransferase [Candidatus Dormibacteraeota bacterium]|nr:tRNA (adenine-N1)-methyltransferase [Candidatus Dormibacteraeota bacterium]
MPLGTGSPLRAGETILLHDRKGRRYRVRLQDGAKQSLHNGAFLHDELIGRPEGSIVTTAKGGRLLALRPTFPELLLERQRVQVQPIYPTDLGGILMHADVCPGARVVEAGTGSAALTMALVRAVGPDGHVFSYEARPEFHDAAVETVATMLGGAPANLTLRVGDVYEAIEEREIDRVLLDLPEPWRAVGPAAEALLPGGVIFAHCPNISQVQRYFEALREHGGFGLLTAMELLERQWMVRGARVRPVDRMVGHTGFLAFARRLAVTEVFEIADRPSV